MVPGNPDIPPAAHFPLHRSRKAGYQPNRQPAAFIAESGTGEARRRVGRRRGLLTSSARQSLMPSKQPHGTYFPKGICVYGAWLPISVSARTNKRHHHLPSYLITSRRQTGNYTGYYEILNLTLQADLGIPPLIYYQMKQLASSHFRLTNIHKDYISEPLPQPKYLKRVLIQNRVKSFGRSLHASISTI
jgi:hypothetical protein